MTQESRASAYQFFMLGLCVYVLAALAVQTFATLDPETVRIIDFADVGICSVFFLDFLVSLAKADNRGRYFVTWGWLDLISSIPTIDLLRWGRAARVFRIIRVLRGLRATRILSTFVLERRAQSALWAALLFSILVTIFSSIAIIHLERPVNGNIVDAEDALWWAFVTITTVGYGDHYPVSPSGRVLAAGLMATGIGLFGTFTAFVASSFMSPGEEEQERELEAIRCEIRELRDELRGGPPAS